MKDSIQSEISKLVVGAVLLVALAFSSFIFLYSWLIEDNIFNRQVTGEANYIKQNFALTGKVIQPRTAYMSLHANWQGLPSKAQLKYMQDPKLVELTDIEGRTLHIQVFSLGQVEYVLAADVAGFEVSKDYFPFALSWLGLMIFITCVLVAGLALFKARRITQPLNKLTAQIAGNTQSGEPTNLALGNIQIDEHYPDNEIGFLAKTTRQVLAGLTEAWNRETNFTKDVSHEIRTPVAVSKNILAKPLSEIDQLQWQQLRTENIRIEQITQTLLALARNESTQIKQVNVTALVEHCLLTNLDINQSSKGQAIKFNIAQQPDIFKLVNENLVELMLNNLLSNIVHYSSAQQVEIKITEDVLTLKNSHNSQVPQQLSKSGEKGELSQGLGHGLNIVERIAEVYNWQVRTEITQDTFTLHIHY